MKPMDNTRTTARQVERAASLLKLHQETNKDGSVRDVLADFMHYCEAMGLDFDHELSMATNFYSEERKDQS